MPIQSYRDLEVYQRAKKLIVPVYDLAATLPDQEKYDLCDQLRRTCKSVATNIVYCPRA